MRCLKRTNDSKAYKKKRIKMDSSRFNLMMLWSSSLLRQQRKNGGSLYQKREYCIQKKIYRSGKFNLSYTKKIFFPSSSFSRRLHLRNRPRCILYVYHFRSGGRLLGVSGVSGSSIISCFDAGGRLVLCSGCAWFASSLRLLDYRAQLCRKTEYDRS